MKFRDPKTGEVFEVKPGKCPERFCRDIPCCGCPIADETDTCSDWVNGHPYEAARQMGYEVVEPATGETQGGKSLFCEHIGVAPGLPFIVHGYPFRSYPPMVYDADGCVRLFSPDGQRRHKVGGRAITWMMDHPESVEPCRGYAPHEVAFKKEELMERTDKPRICEVLGVEVYEEFNVHGFEDTGPFSINEDGCMVYECGDADMNSDEAIYVAINNPDRIIRKPRFTEEEAADARAVERIYRSAVVGRLENGEIYTSNREMSLMEAWSSDDRITYLPKRLFPSLSPGQSVALADICGC